MSLWFALSLLACPKVKPPPAPEPLPAEVYAWRPSEATASPELLSQLMRDFYDPHLLVSVERSGSKANVLVASVLPGGGQDRCAETSALGGIEVAADGSFSAPAEIVAFAAGPLQARLHKVTLEGKLGSGSLSLGRVSGLLDTRDFLPLLGAAEPSALCDMMPAMGSCAPCPDGQSLCWGISLSGAPTPSTAPAPVPRTRDEICADPECSGRCPAP